MQVGDLITVVFHGRCNGDFGTIVKIEKRPGFVAQHTVILANGAEIILTPIQCKVLA
jgi:ribosomal protein S4E